MPSKSPEQHNLMEMVAHDPAAAKRTGVPQSVGKDFVAADKAKGVKGRQPHPKALAAALRKHKPPAPAAPPDTDADGM